MSLTVKRTTVVEYAIEPKNGVMWQLMSLETDLLTENTMGVLTMQGTGPQIV